MHARYYRGLRPHVHYIPFYSTSAEDILEVLPNLTAHDDAVRAIGKQGQAFARSTLHVDARMCYWRRLLQQWSLRLAYVPHLEARPRARADDGHYTCGECRRNDNPMLIGPWPPTHRCAAVAGERQSERPGLPAAQSHRDWSVGQCRRSHEELSTHVSKAAHPRGRGRGRSHR
jgi:hypothetical protein